VSAGDRPPGNWAEINDLFHRALEQPPAYRDSFVRKSASNPAILREVLALLSSHERAETFMERPAVNADELMAAANADPLVGRRLGQYQIRSVIGEGGMGVVYLADDTRLGRAVALKAVREQFADDPSRRTRLEREAQAAAALTHAGIATVYALEEFDGRLFIASEYVAGETLRSELGRGPLSGTRLLETAIGIAQPLAAAHARGLVHRDLKPENVIRTHDGAIKILDFGLARLQDARSRDQAITTEGTLLGTPAYMSPEQIRATEVDFRSDLFSFGVVVYELATGVNPFTGGDPASTIARILELEPARMAERVPVSSANTAGLGALTQVVATCLQKDRNARYRSTRELEAALDAARGASVPVLPSTPDTWWWQFHQALASLAYFLLLIPLSYARTWVPGPIGLAFLVAGFIAALTAGTLRLHLWFTVRSYPMEWRTQRDRTALWMRAGDVGFAASLIVAAMTILQTHTEMAIVLIGAAVLVVLAFTVMEPATERAAFRAEQ
jgi:eukaryotic-like serine/threonine-protein kinase